MIRPRNRRAVFFRTASYLALPLLACRPTEEQKTEATNSHEEPRVTPSDPTALWHSPESATANRFLAMKQLVPFGTPQEKALKILGKPTRQTRIHGYAPDPIASKDHYTDEDEIIYEFSDGSYVCLRFDVTKSRDNWRNRPLTGSWCGTTNNFFGPQSTR